MELQQVEEMQPKIMDRRESPFFIKSSMRKLDQEVVMI
jgi:hypothetical protein